MKITDFKNEEAIDLLADILEPVSKILSDKEIAVAVSKKKAKMEVIKLVLKNHPTEIVEVLAFCNGVEVEKYSCNVITITRDLLELLNDKELVDFFQSQGQMMAQGSSTSAMANIEENGQ